MNNEQFNSQQETVQDAQLRQLLQSHLPVASPSDTLRDRVANLAAQTPSPPMPTPRTSSLIRARAWRLAVGTATIAALVIGGSIFWPHGLSTTAMARVELARVDAAMAHVKSAHLERFRVENGKRIKESDLWFQDGKWRIEANERGYIGLYIQGTSWSYDAKSNTAVVDKNSKGLFHRNMTGFSFSNLVHDVANPGAKTTVTPQGTTTVNGRTMKQALVETTDNYENTKISLVVDAETDLPQSGDMRVRTRYGKEGHWQFTFSYNDALPPDLFKPDFGSSVRFVDKADKPVEQAQKPIAQTGASESRAFDKSAVTIRSLEVNPHGSVFLSYQVNNSVFASRGCLALISDSQGTTYRGVGQVGKIYPSTPPEQVIHGFWWVPAKTASVRPKWQARTFTVDFKLVPANLKSGEKFTTDSLKGIRFSIPVKETTATIVPPLAGELDSDFSEASVIEKEQKISP